VPPALRTTALPSLTPINVILIIFCYFRAKSTELLLSPPVAYESDADLETETDSDFYDFEVSLSSINVLKS